MPPRVPGRFRARLQRRRLIAAHAPRDRAHAARRWRAECVGVEKIGHHDNAGALHAFPLEIAAGFAATLVVSREWADEHGLPLKDEFRRTFRVTGPDTNPLDTASWRIEPPAAGTRGPVVVTFPEPLDHGLLMRALGVTQGEATVDGERLTSQPFDVPSSGGIRIILISGLKEAAERKAKEAAAEAAAPPVKGVVVLGGDSRVMMEFTDDELRALADRGII